MSSASIGGIAGRIGDEPWGTTLAAIAQRKLTGQLQLRGDDARLYRIAFVDGVVVGASSPLAVDSIVRVALTSHLISSSQVAAVAKRVAASPQRDEIDCVVESVGLTVEHAIKLRRRAVLQRAARTFAVDRGDYRLELEITLPIVRGIEVDIRTILALGIRMNLSESRLLGDLRKLGARFRLDPAAELSAYDFGADLAPVVEELRDGASIAEIDARHREVEPRVVQSMVYALVAGGACQVSDAVPTPSTRAETTSMRKPATIEDISTRTRTTEWSPGRRPTRDPQPSEHPDDLANDDATPGDRSNDDATSAGRRRHRRTAHDHRRHPGAAHDHAAPHASAGFAAAERAADAVAHVHADASAAAHARHRLDATAESNADARALAVEAAADPRRRSVPARHHGAAAR
jgi:hypothetical protein